MNVIPTLPLSSGESLVSGMVPGSAVAFKAAKDEAGLGSPEVLCYASKSEAMYVRDSLIFRSDSNGEDLEGYAGACVGGWVGAAGVVNASPNGGSKELRTMDGLGILDVAQWQGERARACAEDELIHSQARTGGHVAPGLS